jgi:DNA-directed RNA polymerase subunit RPC12/RpoP
MTASCPKCGKTVTRAKASQIKLEGPSATIKGAAYSCPYCDVILSVEADPFSLVAEIAKALKR